MYHDVGLARVVEYPSNIGYVHGAHVPLDEVRTLLAPQVSLAQAVEQRVWLRSQENTQVEQWLELRPG